MSTLANKVDFEVIICYLTSKTRIFDTQNTISE